MTRWILILFLLVAGCGEPPAPSASGGDTPRIISLSPAISRTLERVGLGPHLVGRSTWCRLRTRDNADVPAVGDLHERDWEGLLRLHPTHVFIQSADLNSDVALVDLAARHGWTLRAWPLRTMVEVDEMLLELPAAFPGLDQAIDLESRCERQSDALARALQPASSPLDRRVLLLSEGVPPLAWGEQTYLGELLASTGAINSIGSGGWKTVSLEDVVRLDPDIILIVSERENPEPPAVAALKIDAVIDGRLHRLIHEDINLPGPHLAGLAVELQSLVTHQ